MRSITVFIRRAVLAPRLANGRCLKSTTTAPPATTDPAVKEPSPSTVEAAMRDFSAKAQEAEKSGKNAGKPPKKPEDIEVHGAQTLRGASFKPKDGVKE
ncbi:hypothetical protein HDU89_008284 [Geranomyces variabilis]|nr:hypothetical protein HDU89_008284 [Geranomyces variabilis]